MKCPFCKKKKYTKKVYKEVLKMSQELSNLQDQVAALIADVKAEGDVVASAVVAIKGLTDAQALLTQQLQDAINANDPVAVQAAADAISAQNQAIVDQTSALAAAIPVQP
jgi:hypothetical protein